MFNSKPSGEFLRWYSKYMSFMGVAGQSMFLFQIAKILYTHSARDVSFTGVFVAFISMLSWAFYGYFIGDKVLIRVNIVGVTLSCACLIVIAMYS